MGFGVAIVWIMAIADEVVDVLQVTIISDCVSCLSIYLRQTFGFIFGLSDAIIGLSVTSSPVIELHSNHFVTQNYICRWKFNG